MWSSSSIPTNAAWAVLKESGGRGNYDLTRIMDPKDVEAAANYTANLPSEKQEIMQKIGEAFYNLPDNAKGQLVASAHRLIDEHRGNLGSVLARAPEEMPESIEPGTFKINKLVPLIIGVVFALDALNRSQGAKASLVGNVFTDIGNEIVEYSGGGSNFLGETDYGDVFEWEDTASYINPITGEPIGEPIEDPSIWQRVSRGAVSAFGSLINPFAVVGAGARASGRATGAASEGLTRLGGKATQGAGKKLGVKGMQTEGAEAVARAGRNKTTRLEELGKFHDATGGTGKYGKLNRLTGAGSRGNYPLRALQGAAHSPGIRELAGTIAAGTIPQGSSPNIQGTASATPSAGAVGAGMAGVGNRASMGMGDKQIWSGEMERQRGGAYGQHNKGENMKLGEQLLKETKDKMDGKSSSKKPAHGMVIVIGTNAGPGPIKDGKRVKKD